MNYPSSHLPRRGWAVGELTHGQMLTCDEWVRRWEGKWKKMEEMEDGTAHRLRQECVERVSVTAPALHGRLRPEGTKTGGCCR